MYFFFSKKAELGLFPVSCYKLPFNFNRLFDRKINQNNRTEGTELVYLHF